MNEIDNLEPSIAPLVQSLINNAKIGICSAGVKITDIRTGQVATSEKPNGDRFKLRIPYAGITLEWDIIFFGNNANYPPDFSFDDKSFLPSPKKLEALENWNKNDPDIMVRLIGELFNAYKERQISLVMSNERMQMELESLLANTAYTLDDIEVIRMKKSAHSIVQFLIRLAVDFSDIPPVFLNGNAGEDSVVLMVSYTKDFTKVTPQLFLSPRLENALGGHSNLRIPNYPPDGCLFDYIPVVQELLQNKMRQVVVGYERRKAYTAAFLAHFGSSILEWDMELFGKLSFLFEKDEFFFIVHINIPAYFPQDRPRIILQSIYTLSRSTGKPCYTRYDDYPYNPRWSPDEMAEKAKDFILSNVDIFRRTQGSFLLQNNR